MHREPSLNVKLNPVEGDIELLRSRLVEYNLSRAPQANYTQIFLSLDNDEGELVGGLYAQAYYSWMFVELFWVAESARGRGYGTRLLSQAEEQARHHGCHSIWLDTFSFQARGFYEKCGYRLFGELPHYPAEHYRYFLCKKLD